MKNTNVIVLQKTDRPQWVASMALHCCYSETPISNQSKWWDRGEPSAGKIVVDRCLKFKHWSPLEYPHISFSIEGYPHSVMAQSRTHRHISHQVMSFRYSGKRFKEWYLQYYKDILSEESIEVFERMFYIREAGIYKDRFGNKIDFADNTRTAQIAIMASEFGFLVERYLIDEAMPYEMFRDLIPSGYRQHFVAGGNLRAWLHFLDMRSTADAQSEISHLATQISGHLTEWCPEIMEYYNKSRARKNLLAP